MMEGLHGHRKRDSVSYISSTVRKKMNTGLSVSLIFIMYVRACVHTHVHIDAHRGQRRCLLGQLQAVVSCLKWVLGTEFGFSSRASC